MLSTLGLLQRTAIGALYISTELFLLTDTSLDYQDTWEFSKSRIAEMHLLANSANWNSVATGDTAIAVSAVATSLGGAVVSLLQPAARGAVSAAASTVVPHLATFLQPVRPETRGDGTRASDYNVMATAILMVTLVKMQAASDCQYLSTSIDIVVQQAV